MQFSMEAGLVVDMSVQSVLALANSTLVSRYCVQSPELRLLARKVKEFANAWDVNSGKDGTMSSYGYTLLCIHFLQNAPLTGANVPVLPVSPGWRSDYGQISDRENVDPNNKAASWSWNKPILDPSACPSLRRKSNFSNGRFVLTTPFSSFLSTARDTR